MAKSFRTMSARAVRSAWCRRRNQRWPPRNKRRWQASDMRSSKLQDPRSGEAPSSKFHGAKPTLPPRRSLVLGYWCLFGVWILVLGSSPLLAAPALTDLTISPSDVHLSTKHDRQSLVVQAAYADGVTRDVTDKAKFTLADKSLARFDGATLHPLADGTTELTVKVEGRTLKVPVTVEQA